ncbi:CPBP family intramembrane glutamic endopeptidase [Acinetobacter defluvii]|uniref:CPBP family intramembrane glutamic endopeptidase n=1 Tax=Acinetobacter defluvii TaxID=1871111 RepID=UPI003AF6E1E5
MSSFLTLVHAERFPQKIQWNLRDSFAVLLLPFIFLNSLIFQHFHFSHVEMGIADSLFRGILFGMVCVLYKTMLYEHWQKYKAAFWRSSLLVLVGAVILQIVISVTRAILPISTSSDIENTVIQPESVPFLSLLLISLSPLFTALLEDIVFRYTLLHKLFIPSSLWRIVILLLNSIIFGLIHFHNFDGNLIATISFMAAGLFLNLIYLWTRNIWHVLLIHFLNNAVLSVGGLILLQLVQALA